MSELYKGKKMKSLKTDWESYLNQIVPKHAGEVQKRETKQAFYAGAWALFTLVLHGDPEDLDRAQNELVEFYKEAERAAQVNDIIRLLREKAKMQ